MIQNIQPIKIEGAWYLNYSIGESHMSIPIERLVQHSDTLLNDHIHYFEDAALSVIQDNGRNCSLAPVIQGLKRLGYNKEVIDHQMIELHERGIIRLELGCPIGRSEAELRNITITRGLKQFAYVKVLK